MDEEERLKRIVEDVLKQYDWSDEQIQSALLAVARAHIWKQGLWARMKFIVNVAGFVGAVSALFMAVFALFGWEIVRR